MTKKFICVACPRGCQLCVEQKDDGEIVSILGNNCKRGIAYAMAELSNPTRSFHSTLRVNGAARSLISVKSSQPVPKAQLFDFAKATHGVTVQAPIAIGDVLLANVCGTGIDLIATNRLRMNAENDG